jgi:hypothetical protein
MARNEYPSRKKYCRTCEFWSGSRMPGKNGQTVILEESQSAACNHMVLRGQIKNSNGYCERHRTLYLFK